jgi:hypothetical protein
MRGALFTKTRFLSMRRVREEIAAWPMITNRAGALVTWLGQPGRVRRYTDQVRAARLSPTGFAARLFASLSRLRDTHAAALTISG